jgi:hypothetical protein
LSRPAVRYLLIAAAVLVVALVVTQFALPPYLAGKVEDRLTERGGTATVDLDAVPAVRLLGHDGNRFRLDGRGLEFPLDQKQAVFDKLDGFDSVEMRLTDITAGPFKVQRFDLSRDGGGDNYRMTAAGRTSFAQVSDYLSSGLPPFLSSLLGGATRVTGPAATRLVPFTVAAELASDNGEPRLVTGNGTVAGIPTGPFAALLAQAILSRI